RDPVAGPTREGDPGTGREEDLGPPRDGACRDGARPGPTRWGICGAGHISHDFAVALKTLPPEEHVLLAVAARDLCRAQDFAQRHGVPRAYGGYQALAEDPDVDVVYVGTVNPQHLPVARLMLAARKPLLVEKPLGLNREEVQEAAELAQAQGVFLMEGFWTRFFPAWRRLQELLSAPPAEGALGEPLLLVASLGFDLRARARLREPALGGGALLDLGGYGLQMALALLGTPRDITARGCLHRTGTAG
ncbi:DHDH dehydrogenase, partial [Ramphastos sulfuratus]|nr:DHDH dehydrogenase [Ramphastos sulfuratus]